MKLNLSQIFDGTIYKLDLDESLNIDISDEALNKEHDIKLEKPVNISGSIYGTEDGVYLSANLTYEYIEKCARCLTEFSEESKNVLSAKIIENSNQQVEEENDNDDEEIIFYDSRKTNLEIEDLILDTIELNLPMKSICSEDCEGLCPTCGKDLNVEKCDCTKDDIDPRLEKLKELFD